MSASADSLQSSLSTAGYTDGLGRRSIRFDREVGGMLECLELRPEFGLYEALLRTAARALAAVDDAHIGPISAIERDPRGLVVLSPLVPGQRLEELLEARSADEYAGPGIDAALGFLVQALPAVSRLHEVNLVHGTIAPGRMALTPSGQIVLLDCIYAAALDRLGLNRQALWSSLAVAAPAGAGGARFDRLSDLRQVSLAALAIALGRPLQDAHRPDVVARLLQEVTEVAQIRGGERFAVGLRVLLGAASGAQAEGSARFADVVAEARRLAGSLGTETCLAALTDLARFQVSTTEPLVPAPVAAVRPPAPAIVAAPLPTPVPTPVPDPVPVATVAPDLSLDISESVEISFDVNDEPEVLELELPSDDTLVVAVERSRGSGSFDWKPDGGSLPDPHPVPAVELAPAVEFVSATAATPAEFDWTPDPAVVEQAGQETGISVPAQVESPAQEPAAAAPPAPPPGIPLFRPAPPEPVSATATPAVTPAAAPPPPVIPPAPAIFDERKGMTLYTPPPSSPVPVPAPPAPPMQFAPAPFMPAPFTPAPAPVNVVIAPAPAAAPAVTLRLKTEPHDSHGRPRGTFTDTVSRGSVEREPFLGSLSQRQSAGGAWKIVAAACMVLAVGAFAGRPYLDGRTEGPASTEASTPPVVPVAEAASTGGLQIETQPSGAAVLLNGEDVGRTPLKLDAVKPGRHIVTLSTDSATVRRTVRIEAGKVVTLDVPVYSGWVAIYSPVPLHVSEGPRSLGTTETTRIMLSPGRHELTFTSRELGYSAKHTVEIVPGEERVLNLEPKGSVSVNALPWAEVWVDGARMGETPLANLEIPLGTREFIFKHPTYGERRITTVITAKAPPLSVDFTRPGTRP